MYIRWNQENLPEYGFVEIEKIIGRMRIFKFNQRKLVVQDETPELKDEKVRVNIENRKEADRNVL